MRRLLGVLVCVCGILRAYSGPLDDIDEDSLDDFGQGIEGSIGPVDDVAEWGRLHVPLALSITGLTIGKADFENRDGRIGYSTVEGTLHFGYDFDNGHVLAGEAGYLVSHLGWDHNPFFSQRDFHTGYGAFAYITPRICDWLWRLSGTIGVDTDADSWGHGAQYGWQIWGRYKYSQDWTVHLGVMGLDGMHRQHSWPILGFQVQLDPHWFLSLVYPVDVSLQYKWGDSSALGIAVKSLLAIHRTGPDERTPSAIFQYKNTGVEAFMQTMVRHWLMRVGAGVMAGDDIKIFNSDGRTLRLYKIGSSAFAEARAGFIF